MRSLPIVAVAIACIAPQARAQEGPSGQTRNDPRTILKRLESENGFERRLALVEVKARLGLVKKPAPPRWTPRTSGKGRLDIVKGVPVLRLEGTPEEMGEQAGTLVGEESRALAECYLPSFMGTRAELEKARVQAREMFWPNLTEDEQAEIQAFAKASGISLEDMLLAQGFADLYRAWACSTIGATGPAAPGEPVLARNLDFVDMGFLHDYSCVLVAHPKNKQAYVAVTWPGLVGVLSGMNDQGVALAVMVVHDEEGCAPGVPFGIAFRRALEQSKSAADVSALLSNTQLTVANNLMVVDGNGDALLLELAPTSPGVVERHPDARGLLFSTNHFQSPARKETRMSLTYLSSTSRLRAVENACVHQDVLTVPVAIAALRAGAAGIRNVQSMVFLPKSGKLYVALGKPPAAQHEFVELDAESLLGG